MRLKQLAARVVEDIKRDLQEEEDNRMYERDQRELVWAREQRDALFMRHPTNWVASLCSVFDGCWHGEAKDNL